MGGMGGIMGGGMRFARQYPALLHPYISQQDLFAELDKAEAILADAMRGSISPAFGFVGFLAGMAVSVGTGFSGSISLVPAGFVICVVSMIFMRAAKVQRGLDAVGMHLTTSCTPKYPALTFLLAYDRVLSTYRRQSSNGFSRNELRVSRVPKITIQVTNDSNSNSISSAQVGYP